MESYVRGRCFLGIRATARSSSCGRKARAINKNAKGRILLKKKFYRMKVDLKETP
jgi:hypothetical protein